MLIGLLLAGLALRLVFMFISLEHLPVSSDEAMVVLQAKQIAQGQRPLLFLAQPYQFPLGAYAQSVLVESLPRNAWGVRYYSLGLGLLSFLGLWLLIIKLAPPSRSWPALVLMAFPSAYLLLYQAAYPVPQYDSMLFLWLAASWLTFLMKDRTLLACLGLGFLVGAACGLGLSVHMLSLSLLAPMALAACLRGGLRRAPLTTLAVALGSFAGLAPLLLVHWLHPEAVGRVAGQRGLWEAFSLRHWQALKHATAGVLGSFSPTFPDFHEQVALGAWPIGIFPLGFALLLLAAGVVSFRGLARRGKGAGGTNAGYLSVFALAPWIGMILFLFNDRANSGQYRYLIVMVWCLPFLFLQLQAVAGRYTRTLLGCLALFLAAFNLLMSFTLMETWTRPGFAARHARMPDPKPAMALLRQNNISHCFAAYWTAYRITFLSDGEITCSQPNNERFPGWPIPFKEEVLRAPRAAYVLTAPDSFDSGFFERDLASCGVACNKTKAGSYTVYQDFIFKNASSESLIPWREVEVSASHNPSGAQRLSDGYRNRKWDNGQGQQEGMWLELRLKKPRPLNRVSLHYHDYAHDQAKVLKISYLQNGRWRSLGPEVPAGLDKCPNAMRIPVREEQVKTIRFKPVLTDALRLEIAEPQKGRLWTMAEVEVFYQGRQVPPERD